MELDATRITTNAVIRMSNVVVEVVVVVVVVVVEVVVVVVECIISPAVKVESELSDEK